MLLRPPLVVPKVLSRELMRARAACSLSLSLLFMCPGAAPLGAEVELAAKARLGCVVKQAWGMSELSPIGTVTPDDDVRTGSSGPPVASMLYKVGAPPNEASPSPGPSIAVSQEKQAVFSSLCRLAESFAVCIAFLCKPTARLASRGPHRCAPTPGGVTRTILNLVCVAGGEPTDRCAAGPRRGGRSGMHWAQRARRLPEQPGGR